MGKADALGAVARDWGIASLGLASNVKVKRKINQGDEITWRDVEVDNSDLAVRMRREMEAAFAPAGLEAVRSTG